MSDMYRVPTLARHSSKCTEETNLKTYMLEPRSLSKSHRDRVLGSCLLIKSHKGCRVENYEAVHCLKKQKILLT